MMDQIEDEYHSRPPPDDDDSRPATERRYQAFAASYRSRQTSSGRTLRTYSKRTRPVEDDGTENAAKKQKVTLESATTAPSALPKLPPPPPASTSNIPKSSILSYFKPCRSSSGTEHSDPLSDSEKIITTPPSSPPVVRRIKEPRRLRLRHAMRPVVSKLEDTEQDGEDEEEQDDEPRKLIRPGRFRGRQLLETRESKLNEQRDTRAAEFRQSQQKPKPRSKPTPTVQTTINISSKPTFEECKICRMVFNPLHPPDVKFHTQAHAAYLRAKTKARA
ncbi:hypothetical protein Cob_v011851 [Colletotrichum orbiculare MAFF 240422]|uniref:N-acetyltransferase ESCO zinc-finger domain-containing protein n=1 Tax=Colletotrichum orbiculare (strain 104-T / ATCC 96160 / CBS 514.97 / LARS 414 / MAFF 240422) TaxID=1213857 RepID=A0A484FAK3_COLOR|nr:hypothetical protein Cob_v011851 [Colletotrichum orbiculare MAFF 240422]